MNKPSSAKPKWAIAAFCVITSGIILGLICWKHWWQRSPSSDSTDEGDTPAAQASAPQASPGSFRILSETTNGNRRVVRVERGGKQTEVRIPVTMAVSPEDLEALAFQEPEPPKQDNREAILTKELHFYGVCVDGESNALAGVNIDASVLVVSPQRHQGYKTFTTQSGADGRFSFAIPWGQQLVIRTSRTNYVAPPEKWFLYGPVGPGERHVPDVARPVVFQYAQKKEEPPLHWFEKGFRIANDGKPVRVDLVQGQLVTEGGDLIVTLHAMEPYTNLRPFPWKVGVEVVNGGLIEAKVNPMLFSSMPEAPANGYQPGFMLEYGPTTPTYLRQHDGMYYVKARNGSICAKVRFTSNPRWDERGIGFGIGAYVNTNGTRYLHNVGR